MKKCVSIGLICGAGLAALVCGSGARAQKNPPIIKTEEIDGWRHEVEFPAIYKNPRSGRKFSEKIIFNAANGDYTLLSWEAAEALGLGSDDGATFTPSTASGLTSTRKRIKSDSYVTLRFVSGFPMAQQTGIDDETPEIDFIAVTSKRGFPITGIDASGLKITIKIKTVYIEKRRGFASQHTIIGGDWADHADLVFFSQGRSLYW